MNLIFFAYGQKKLSKNKKKRFKAKFIYLPFGFDSLSIPKLDKVSKKKREKEINFIGTFDKNRLNILEFINIKKKIYGGNWIKLNKTKIKNVFFGPHIYRKDIFKLMNRSAISLNILRKQNYSAHNMRTFEIPANNGLMLTTRSNEQNKFFKENKACFMFSTKKELKKKIKFIFTKSKKSRKSKKVWKFYCWKTLLYKSS